MCVCVRVFAWQRGFRYSLAELEFRDSKRMRASSYLSHTYGYEHVSMYDNLINVYINFTLYARSTRIKNPRKKTKQHLCAHLEKNVQYYYYYFEQRLQFRRAENRKDEQTTTAIYVLRITNIMMIE